MKATGPAAEALARFREDAARWVRPQEVVPAAEITPTLMMRLLLRYPPLRAMAWFRIATFATERGVRGVPSWIQRRLLRLYGLELVPGNDIGGGFYIAHPVGCVLVAERVGRNVTVIGQVTFGTRTDKRWPRIGDGVFVGAGARIIGGIEVGAGARVGSNAVVMDSVPADTTVVGIPARPVIRASMGVSN